jgi:carbon-monoxide dehydrogenase large subunit|tara:strand:+ start:1565 stop:3805 length:2241 start_codon:yes stop_codon:yes gene_type:complete
MLHAAFLRSPHAHARIRSVDVAAALRMPGVEAVLTGDDILGIVPDLPTRSMSGEWEVDEFKAPEHPALAVGKVSYVGQTVAVVVAQDPGQARDALELIQVDYEPLPVVLDPWEAASSDSIPIHDELGTNVALRIHHDRQGEDLDKAFAQADRIVEQRYDVQRLAPVPMETRGLVAHYQPEDDFLTIWASTQGAHRVQRQTSRLLDFPEAKIRVIAPDVGGGFGEKGGVFPEDLAVSYLALKLGKPVKWVADRQENMLGFHGRGHSVNVEAAVQNDGTILGIRLQIVGDGGAYFGNSTPGPPYRASHRIIGPYKTPTARIEVLGVVTNKPPTGAYRGAGGPESAFCMERTVDLVARELGLDPVEVRRKNFISPDDFPYMTPTGLTYDSGDYDTVFDRTLEMADYSGWREKARESKNGNGPLIGVGVATVIKMSGGSGESRNEEAWLKIEPDGRITVLTGISPHGQGSATAFAQVVADQLGVTPADVQVLHGDTAVVPSGGGTGATRATVVGGSALYLVAEEARHKLVSIAAHQLGCAEVDVVLEEGQAFSRHDPGRTVAFRDLAAAAYSEEQLPPGVTAGLDFSGSFTLGQPYQSPHSFSTHVVAVQVNRENGVVEILSYTAIHDCGRILNPMLVEGQVHGGIAQGIGQALWEGMAYSPDGQPLTASLMDYAMPSAQGLPELNLDTYETPSPMNPLGIKGVGELPTVAAPAAVANAVMDALSGFGVRHIDTPLTPEKVWNVMQGAAE